MLIAAEKKKSNAKRTDFSKSGGTGEAFAASQHRKETKKTGPRLEESEWEMEGEGARISKLRTMVFLTREKSVRKQGQGTSRTDNWVRLNRKVKNETE